MKKNSLQQCCFCKHYVYEELLIDQDDDEYCSSGEWENEDDRIVEEQRNCEYYEMVEIKKIIDESQNKYKIDMYINGNTMTPEIKINPGYPLINELNFAIAEAKRKINYKEAKKHIFHMIDQDAINMELVD
jgi:hypothetical protein